MSKNPDFGTDTDSARIFAYLCQRPPAPAPGRAPTPACMPRHRPATTAAEIARREGLDLDLPPAGRPARPVTPRPRREQTTARKDRRGPSAEDIAVRTVQSIDPALSRAKALDLAKQWIQSGCSLLDLDAWITALGLYNTVAARHCLERGLTLSSLETVVDGMQVRRRVRAGESVDSTIALAAVLGIALAGRSTQRLLPRNE